MSVYKEQCRKKWFGDSVLSQNPMEIKASIALQHTNTLMYMVINIVALTAAMVIRKVLGPVFHTQWE